MTSGTDMLWRLLCLTLAGNLQVIKNEAAYMNYPMRSDFAECELVTEEKEQFLDLHNKLRGMVNPTAADMEYLVRKKWKDIYASKLFTFKALSRCAIFHGLAILARGSTTCIGNSCALRGICSESFAERIFVFYFPQRFSQVWFEFKNCVMKYLSCFFATFKVLILALMPSANARFRWPRMHRKRMYRNAHINLTLVTGILFLFFSLGLGWEPCKLSADVGQQMHLATRFSLFWKRIPERKKCEIH